MAAEADIHTDTHDTHTYGTILEPYSANGFPWGCVCPGSKDTWLPAGIYSHTDIQLHSSTIF